MASNEIKHRIALEGDADINNRLDAVGEHGKRAFKEIKETIDNASPRIAKIGNDFAAVGGGAQGGSRGVEAFREAIHVLHPVLDTAGLGLGNLGSFARVAGGGLGALAAAIVGSLLVGLAKIADESDRAKRRLDLLTGAGKSGGESQFEALNKDAKDLGTTLSTIVPLAESLFKYRQQNIAQDRNVIHPPGYTAGAAEEAASGVQVFNGNQSYPGGAPSPDIIRSATRAVVEAGKLDRSTPEESIGAGKEFFDAALGGNGLVTTQMLDKLPPALADAVTRALSGSGTGGTGQTFENISAVKKFIDQGGRVTGGQTLAGLARVEPDIREQAAKVPLGVTEEFGRLEAATKSLAEAFSGDIGLAGGIDRIVKLINEATQNVDKFLHPRDYEPGGPKFIGPVSGPEKQEYNKPDLVDLGKTLLTGKSDPRFDDSNPNKVAKFLHDGPAALQQTPSEALDYLGKASHEPNASSQQQQPFIQETNSGAGVSAELKSAVETGDNQIVGAISDGLGSVLGSIRDALINFLSKPATPAASTEPASVLGVRGATGGYVELDGGGHVRGPGTATSDSIPAMLSDGEYVIRQKAVAAIGVENLDRINNSLGLAAGGFVRRFAEGGAALKGNLTVSYDPTTGGAYVNGNLYPPGSPILDDPDIQAAIARSKADMNVNSSGKGNFGSTRGIAGSDAYGAAGHAGGYAAGGLVGDRGRGSFMHRLTALGFAGGGLIDVPHLAAGGMPEAPPIAAESLASGALSSGGMDLSHFGRVDLTTNHGTFPVITHEDTLRHMNTAAVEARTFSAGSKPGWYGG